jgi:hypothetical protein
MALFPPSRTFQPQFLKESKTQAAGKAFKNKEGETIKRRKERKKKSTA